MTDGFVPISELAPRIGEVERIELAGPFAYHSVAPEHVAHYEQIAAGAHAQMLRRLCMENCGRPQLRRVK
jgi:hypothetical protein